MTDTHDKASKRNCLRLPVVSAGAEYLVMGMLMRRNILTYKAPKRNEDNTSGATRINLRERMELPLEAIDTKNPRDRKSCRFKILFYHISESIRTRRSLAWPLS